MRLAVILASMGLALGSGAAHAETGPLQQAIGDPADFKLSGSVRLRYETEDGQPIAGRNADDDAWLVRTIITAQYREGPIRAMLELHDARGYGGRAGGGITALEVNPLEPIQAWVAADLGPALGAGSKTSVTAGRFTLAIGSRRFVTADDYRNSTQGMTGVRIDTSLKSGTAATLFYVLPQSHLPADQPSLLRNKVALDRESFALQLWGGLLTQPLPGGAGVRSELGYYGLRERDGWGQVNRNRRLHTLSARLVRDPKPGRPDFDFEGAYQFGSIRSAALVTAPRQDVSASFFHAGVGYQVPGALNLRLSAFYDRASGDGPGGRYARYDNLFGSRRNEYGPAGIDSAIGRSNISSPGVMVELAPGKRFDAMAMWRDLWLADRTDAFASTGVRDVSGASGSHAGNQIDMRMRYWLVPGLLRAEVNATWLIKSRFLNVAPNAPRTGDMHYLATSIMASF